MKILTIIDIEGFSEPLINGIAAFRKANPSVKAFWTVTGEDQIPENFPERFGFKEGDEFFIKPDIDSSIQGAYNGQGQSLYDRLQESNVSQSFVMGQTFYGCVLGAGRDLQELSANPYIIQEFTDYHELKPCDHEEAREDWGRANIPVINRFQAVRMLKLNGGMNLTN